MKRTVFFISDGTGITAASLGNSLLTQFDQMEFHKQSIPYVNNMHRAQEVVQKIQDTAVRDGVKPLIFTTLVDPEIHATITETDCLVMDFFKTFIGPLEQELGCKSSHTVGKTHGLRNYHDYMVRIEAVNYALSNDDGANIHDYSKADCIMVGVSRCGKTPTCLYMALQFGINAANYPITEDDTMDGRLPKALQPFKNKIFGLTIEPERLQSIREQRRPNSEYASLKRCRYELAEVESLFQRENIPFLNTTHRSIEEIATEVLTISGISRKVF